MTFGLDVAALADRIEALQDADGRISWIEAGVFDPWNHTESAMGLVAAGRLGAARAAFDHLAETQRADGLWDAEMGCAAPLDPDNRRLLAAGAPPIVDLNFCAYPAVGVWRLARATGERADATRWAGMVERALGAVIAYQRPGGELPWRPPERGERLADVEALLSACSAIHRSLLCGTQLLGALDRPAEPLAQARQRLGRALRERPEAFAAKDRYAMDWYYPVLSGAWPRAGARARLALRWRDFVDPVWGCRCVFEEPWATPAETAELALAAHAGGATRAARALLVAIARHQAPGGGLWMGRQMAEQRPWPEERPSWTAGAALMALDAVCGLAPGGDLFALPVEPAAERRQPA